MRFQGLPRAFFALWLALAALAANAFEQRALGFNVIAATAEAAPTGALAGATHVMPDGTVMAGPMGHAHETPGGHTHKGHADCELCGFIADMAAFTLASLTVLPQPPETFAGYVPAAPNAQRSAAARPPYASRAPPSLV
ncbi:MAG: DUF2946 family protein [Rhodospirillaceae bacterium]|nr:DUF2946 family protein [Rhodospirillaceae bacterium]